MPELDGVLTQLAQQLGTLQKTIAGVDSSQMTFGPTGLFSHYGLDQTVINLSMTPRGIDAELPVFPSATEYPFYAYLTGFESDADASEPVKMCDDAPGGEVETCHQTATFGLIQRASKEENVVNLLKQINRGVMTDLRIMGSVLGKHPFLSTMNSASTADWFKYVTLVQMVCVGIEFQKKLARMVWTGNPANNTAGGGYMEFPGLDMLISTGKIDAFTQTTCPSLDSYIYGFNHNLVTGSSPDIVRVLSFVMSYLPDVARGTGIEPVEWIFAMRPQLFRELCEIWPCRYLTSRCANSAGTNVTVLNDRTNVDMRDAMYNGKYLLIDGIQYRVVLDDGIYEANSTNHAGIPAGQYSSDIYVLPLRASGQPMLYWEFVDFSSIPNAELAVLNGKQQFWATDGGRYMWTLEQDKWCFKMQGLVKPRLILRTPHLAARITDVMYQPLAHLRDSFDDDPYFVKGGAPSFDTPSGTIYSDWNNPQR